jgi:hypothetical protein
MFYESRLLYVTLPLVPPAMAAVTIGTTIALLVGLFDDEWSGLVSYAWLPLLGLCLYLFLKGIGFLHPLLLGVHFGSFAIVSGALFATALSRSFDLPTGKTLVNEVLDLTAVAIFAVFQMVYVIGDRVRLQAPDRSLGKVVRKGQVADLLDILVLREEAGMKEGVGFE